MSSTLKNRVVLRPKGEPVIGPPILKKINPVHKLTFYFHNVLFNIILTSVLQSSVFFAGFSVQDFVYISCFKSSMLRTYRGHTVT
jgi:hypothetical protein